MTRGFDWDQIRDILGALPRDEGFWPELRAGLLILGLDEFAGSEACWELLSDGRVSDAVWRYYDPGQSDETILDIALVIEQRACGLFATNRACAAMSSDPGAGAIWLSRALEALGGPSSRVAVDEVDVGETAIAVAAALASTRVDEPLIAAVHVWCRWWLGLLAVPGSGASCMTSIAWIGERGAEAGALYVVNTGL